MSRAFLLLALVTAVAHAQETPPGTPPAPAGEPAQADTAPAEGALEDIELLELDIPEVVTASRHKEKLTSVPHAISVITREDIRRAHARSVPDALRLVPGVDVAELTFGEAAVAPRGFHGFISNQTLVLVDGRQIFDSLFGGTAWGSWPFQLDDIERIEVIRGPGGVTWGANAVNGVINIITRDPGDEPGLSMSGGGGSRGTFKQHVGYSLKEDPLRARVSGEYEASDGFRDGGSLLRRQDDEYKAGRMNARAIYELGPKDSLDLSAGSSVVDGGLPPSPLGGIGVVKNSGSQANYLMGKWTHKVSDDNAFDLTGFVNDFHASPGLKAIDYRYQQLALQFGHTFKAGDAHTLSWGVDSRADLLDASNADPHMLSDAFVSTGIIGLYVQDVWRFAPRWALSLGGRIDYEFFGGFEPSARAALSYDLSDDAHVYGAVSRAFHMPTAGSRFLNLPLLNGLAVIQSDRDVYAETLIAYELGYRQRFLKNRLDTGMNLYWHEYDEVTTITPRLGPPGLLAYDFDNRAEASTYGVELDGKHAVTDRLSLLAHYTYQQLIWHASARFQEKDAISPPAHKAMFGTRYSLTDDLHLGSHLYYVDATQAPNPHLPFFARNIRQYVRWDLGADYEFWKDRASVGVGVRNLLDSGHYEGSTLFLNDAEVPRMVYAEMRLRLE
jgi:iron complex outermembrane receptor protein